MFRESLLLPLLLLCLISSWPSVYAAAGEQINISQFPEQLSEAIGIPLLVSQLLISAVFLFAFLLPCAIWGKTSLPTIIVGLALVTFLIAVSWLPFWLLLLIGLIIGLSYAKEIRGLVSGGGGD